MLVKLLVLQNPEAMMIVFICCDASCSLREAVEKHACDFAELEGNIAMGHGNVEKLGCKYRQKYQLHYSTVRKTAKQKPGTSICYYDRQICLR